MLTPLCRADAGKAAAVAPDASCFKEVFRKKVGSATWIVKSCEKTSQFGSADDKEAFWVKFNDERGDQESHFEQPNADGVGYINYSLVSPSTLLVDLQGERGGTAFIIHPVNGKKIMASLKFDYESDDETGLELRQNDNVIYAKTKFDHVQFLIDSSGNLSAMRGRKIDAGRVASLTKCEKKEKEKNGTEDSYSVRLEKSGGEISSIVYSGSSISGREGGAYFCDLKMSKFDKNVMFSKSGNTTTIEFGGDRRSTVQINEISGGFSVDFNNIDQSVYCGAGAQMPEKMTLSPDKKCSVKF